MTDRASNVLAIVFMIVGFALVGAAFLAEPPPKWLVLTGLFTAVFGALMYPSAGAGPAFQQITIGLSSLPIFGGRRMGDIPAPTPADIITTEEKKP